MTAVVIPGMPIAYPRTTVSNTTGRRMTPTRYRHWLNAAGVWIAAAGVDTIDGPTAADVVVYADRIELELRPTGEAGRPKGIRGDLDNYAKAVLDACQHGPRPWILDDRQIVALTARFG